MELMDAIKTRYSCRSFKAGVAIPLEDLNKMVEAAMYAPNAAQHRPWEFVVVQNKDILSQIIAPHPGGPKAWANVAAAIVVVGKPEQNGTMPEEFVFLDGAAAIENILLRATDLGYQSCWCGAYPDQQKEEALCKLLNVEGAPVGTALIGVAEEPAKATGYWQPEKVKYL